MYDLCIFHKNCPDGTAAAWAALQHNKDIELHPASYGEAPPDVTGRRVLVADFSYPRADLERMAAQAVKLRVLDHHETAWADLADLPCCEFDMQRSGAAMAWDHLFPGKPYPWVVSYVQDRDLWRHELPFTRAVSAYLGLLGYDPRAWDKAKAVGEPDFTSILELGTGALACQERMVESIADLAETGIIAGSMIPVVMAPVLWPDVAAVLLRRNPEAPFVATFRPSETGDRQLRYSLASRFGGTNVGQIAKRYGGGGHACAAGFQARGHVHLPGTRKRQDGDGWPSCPRCGEDELYSTQTPVHVIDPLACYRCGWKGQIVEHKSDRDMDGRGRL